MDVHTQADILAYDQIRSYEDDERLAAMMGVKTINEMQ